MPTYTKQHGLLYLIYQLYCSDIRNGKDILIDLYNCSSENTRMIKNIPLQERVLYICRWIVDQNTRNLYKVVDEDDVVMIRSNLYSLTSILLIYIHALFLISDFTPYI